MGCKGSKHKSAAEDAISPQKRTELPNIKTATAVPATVKPAQNAATVAEPAAAAVPDESVKEVKDITVNVEGKEKLFKEEEAAAPVASKVEPGKIIANGSPDRYFSSRKEDDGTESANAGEGLEYYSPTNDSEHGRLSNDGGRDEAPATEEKGTGNTEGGGNEEEIAAVTVDAGKNWICR